MSKNKIALGQFRKVLGANMIQFLKADCEPKISTNRHRIDIRYTLCSLYKSRLAVNNTLKKGKQVLFVGTETVTTNDYPSLNIYEWIKKTANYINVWYVSKYWVGGLLTNYKQVKFAIEEYCNLCFYPPKIIVDARKFTHLKMRYEGLVKMYSFSVLNVNTQSTNLTDFNKTYFYMQDIPDLVVLINSRYDFLAATECYKLSILTIAIIDTDCNPLITGISIVAGLYSGVILPLLYTLLTIDKPEHHKS
tara:strand:- start:391 stop:1137 length:747 start_codon:yes stop_codon:yes gene_type:complete